MTITKRNRRIRHLAGILAEHAGRVGMREFAASGSSEERSRIFNECADDVWDRASELGLPELQILVGSLEDSTTACLRRVRRRHHVAAGIPCSSAAGVARGCCDAGSL